MRQFAREGIRRHDAPPALLPVNFVLMLRTSLIIPLLVISSLSLPAQPVAGKHLDVELIGREHSVQPGRSFDIALRFRMEPGWHIYWRNPGDAGMATAIDWKLPDGFTVSQISWPYPHLFGEAPEVSYGYDGEVLLLVQVTPPADLRPGSDVAIAADASWLVCNDVCIPGKASLHLTLPVSATTAEANASWKDAFAATFSSLPASIEGLNASVASDGDRILLTISPLGNAFLPMEAHFFAAEENMIDHSKPQSVRREGNTMVIELQRSSYATEAISALRGVLVSPAGWDRDGTIRAVVIDLPVTTP